MLKRNILVILVAVESLFLFPITYQPNLRFDYIQTLARWFAKAVPPETVFIGDSITSSGMQFHSFRSINIASAGLQTYQVLEELERAKTFKSKHIVAMAGTNDAGEGPIDEAEIIGLWQKLCAEPRMIVTLPTPTNYDHLNQRLAVIDRIILRTCTKTPIIDLRELADKTGRIRPIYTVDGVHPSPAAHEIWRKKLGALGI